MANPSTTGLIHFGTNAGKGNIRQGKANDYKIALNNVNSIDWFTDATTSEHGSWKPKKFINYWNDQFGSKKLISQANFEENGKQHSIAFQLSKPKAKKN